MINKNSAMFQSAAVTYTCPKDSLPHIAIATENDFSGSEQECELCGSHGNIMVSIQCDVCGKRHSIEIISW